MKFLWRYLYSKMRDVGNEPDSYPRGSNVPTTKMASSLDGDWGDGLNIRVNSAMGGKIVSFQRYDRKTDRNNSAVYVIPDEQDFERELGKLITLESMKNGV